MTADEKKIHEIIDQVMSKLPWDRDIVTPMVAALREEREACAVIAGKRAAYEVATAIRERGQ